MGKRSIKVNKEALEGGAFFWPIYFLPIMHEGYSSYMPYCIVTACSKDTVEITIDTVAAGLLVLLYVPGYGSTSATRYHTATVKYTVPVQHTRYPGKKFTHTII